MSEFAKFIGFAPLTADWVKALHDMCWCAHNDAIVRENAANDGIGAYDTMIAQLGSCLNFGACADEAMTAYACCLDIQWLMCNVDARLVIPMVNVRDQYVEKDGCFLSDRQGTGRGNVAVLLKTDAITNNNLRLKLIRAMLVHAFDSASLPNQDAFSQEYEFRCPEQWRLDDAALSAMGQPPSIDRVGDKAGAQKRKVLEFP
jgi:hypothetical protein